MATAAKGFDPEDDEPWTLGPEAKMYQDQEPPPIVPDLSQIPLDAFHECPCCNGKGFVRVCVEKARRVPKPRVEDD